jgi:hypothetical protein
MAVANNEATNTCDMKNAENVNTKGIMAYGVQ